jgi:DNA recombination protein RmuC
MGQMGLRTLAKEKRSNELWKIHGAMKTEFCDLRVILNKVQTKLTLAGETIKDARVRSRAIGRKLHNVTAPEDN